MSMIIFGYRAAYFGSISKHVSLRTATTVAAVPINHYKVLGLTSKATQSEIKSAYYKLSKVFHPDISGQSEDAAVKFRQITAAYEVLGNLKLRKMYDRGLLPTGSTFHPSAYEDIEDKKPSSPYKRTRSQPMTGKTDVYDFDEWSRLHYGNAMHRRNAAKATKVAREEEKIRAHADLQSDKLLVMVVIGLLILTGMNMVGNVDYDNPAQKKT